MTQEKITDAVTELDPDILDRYFIMKQALAEKKKTPTWVKWTSLAAACLALLICAISIINLKPNVPQNTAPVTIHFNSIKEAHKALRSPTLYSNIKLDPLNPSNITIVYDSYDPIVDDDTIDNSYAEIDGSLGMEFFPLNTQKPREFSISTSYDNGETVDTVDFYILFNKNSVDDSYIGGYVEQGLTKEIRGITVHYCLIEDGTMHGHAKFVYKGDVYVINVRSSGKTHSLHTYIDMVLN